jgi:hypothetical protein
MLLRLCSLLVLLTACSRSSPDAQPSEPERPDAIATQAKPKTLKAFYFGHSLLAGSGASPDYHIPYNIGLFAAAQGHHYEAHGQLGWGTPITAHWEWGSDDLAKGPLGFAKENHAPFYVGRNGKNELKAVAYNLVVFTDVNGNARGADKGPSVDALVGLIKLARGQAPDALAVLYSVWNELPVDKQRDAAAVKKWRDEVVSELAWWEGVADAVVAKTSSGRLLLVPVSVVFAELAVDAAEGRIPGIDATALFSDEVHGTPIAYYAAAAALYCAIFQEPPPEAASEAVRGNVGGAAIDYALPSVQAAKHIQQRALELVKAYRRAGFGR